MREDIAVGIGQKNIDNIVILIIDIIYKILHMQKIHGKNRFRQAKGQAGCQSRASFLTFFKEGAR